MYEATLLSERERPPTISTKYLLFSNKIFRIVHKEYIIIAIKRK